MEEGVKTKLRKTRILVCVATPLQQKTCDTISELQQKFVVYQSYGSSRINQKTNVCSSETMVNQSYGSSNPE